MHLIRILIAVAFAFLSACGYIKSLFPDKGKDYQYTTEIAPLTIPPGLTDNPIFQQTAPSFGDTSETRTVQSKETEDKALPTSDLETESETKSDSDSAASTKRDTSEPSANAPETAETETTAVNGDETQAAAESSPETEPPAGEQRSEPRSSGNTIPVELIIYNDGETRLRISADRTQSWHLLGKALIRNSIEVTERNEDEGTYHVVFEPDEKPVEDGSLWDEAVFLFKGFQNKGKRFILKIIENNQECDVAVLDEDGKTASDKAALRMLKLIHQTLKND